MSDKPWRDIHSNPFDLHEYLQTVGNLNKAVDLAPPHVATTSAEIASSVDRQHLAEDYALVTPLDTDSSRTEMLVDARIKVEQAIGDFTPPSIDLE